MAQRGNQRIIIAGNAQVFVGTLVPPVFFQLQVGNVAHVQQAACGEHGGNLRREGADHIICTVSCQHITVYGSGHGVPVFSVIIDDFYIQTFFHFQIPVIHGVVIPFAGQLICGNILPCAGNKVDFRAGFADRRSQGIIICFLFHGFLFCFGKGLCYSFGFTAVIRIGFRRSIGTGCHGLRHKQSAQQKNEWFFHGSVPFYFIDLIL